MKRKMLSTKKQHILALNVTEVLCDGQSSQGHTCAGTRGLVHLPKHQSALALSSLVANLVDTLQDGTKLTRTSNSQRAGGVIGGWVHDKTGWYPATSMILYSRLTDSIISLYRSLPSRVRSPTPAKTEKPPADQSTSTSHCRPFTGPADVAAINFQHIDAIHMCEAAR